MDLTIGLAGSVQVQVNPNLTRLVLTVPIFDPNLIWVGSCSGIPKFDHNFLNSPKLFFLIFQVEISENKIDTDIVEAVTLIVSIIILIRVI